MKPLPKIMAYKLIKLAYSEIGPNINSETAWKSDIN